MGKVPPMTPPTSIGLFAMMAPPHAGEDGKERQRGGIAQDRPNGPRLDRIRLIDRQAKTDYCP